MALLILKTPEQNFGAHFCKIHNWRENVLHPQQSPIYKVDTHDDQVQSIYQFLFLGAEFQRAIHLRFSFKIGFESCVCTKFGLVGQWRNLASWLLNKHIVGWSSFTSLSRKEVPIQMYMNDTHVYVAKCNDMMYAKSWYDSWDRGTSRQR